MSNCVGLAASIIEVGALICTPNIYTKSSLRGFQYKDNEFLLLTKISNLLSFILGLKSYLFTHAEYAFIDALMKQSQLN